MALLNLVNLKEKRLKKYYYRFGEPCKRMQGVNILDEGLRIIGSSTTEFTLVDYPTMDDRCENDLKSSGRLKQEVNNEQI